MVQATVVLAPGFEEIEAITVIDVLRRANIEVTTLGLNDTRVEGAHGIVVEADDVLGRRSDQVWDLVVLPGGMPGSAHLRDHPEVQGLIERQFQSGRWLAAICAAPMALGSAGVLRGKEATCYPGFEDHLQGATLRQAPVVVDGHVVTSRGPGTALEFALTLVSLVQSAEVAPTLRQQMLVTAPA